MRIASLVPSSTEMLFALSLGDEVVDRIRSTGAGRIVAVDAAASFSRPGPRLVDGIELLAGLLHPEMPRVTGDGLAHHRIA